MGRFGLILVVLGSFGYGGLQGVASLLEPNCRGVHQEFAAPQIVNFGDCVSETGVCDTFDELFGKQIRQVKTTRGTKDDIELAEELWKSSETVKDSNEIRGRILEAVYDLTAKTDAAVKLGISALRALEEMRPERASEYRKKVREVWEYVYRRAKGEEKKEAGKELVSMMMEEGEALIKELKVMEAATVYRRALGMARAGRLSNVKYLQTLTNYATKMMGVVREITKLEGERKAGSLTENSAKRLAMLYVVKFDSPVRVKGFLGKVGEPEGGLIGSAMAEVGEADVKACRGLGEWYTKLAKGEKGLVELRMLSRAEGYLRRYLNEGKENLRGTDQLKLSLMLKRIEGKLATLRGQLGDTGRWKDLTGYFAKMVAAKKYGAKSGEVSHKNGVFSLSGTSTWLPYPANAKDVILSAEIKRVGGLFVLIRGRWRWKEKATGYAIESALYETLILKQGERELTRKGVKETANGKFFEVQFGLIGEQIIVAVNGKKVIQMTDKSDLKAGNVYFGARNAKTDMRRLRIMIPSKGQAKKWIGSLK